jgi:cytochrome c biogenesis protein
MADEARTQPLAGAGLPDVVDRAPVSAGAMGGIDRGLERLWHLLTSMRFAVILILGLALAGLAGTLIVQAPPGVLLDPDAKREWLNEIWPKYGGWTGVMDQLQLFTIFTSVWFRAMGAALAISVIACSVHRIPGLWKTAVRPHVDVGASFFEHAPQHEAIVLRSSPRQALDDVQGVLKRHRYRTVTLDDGVIHMYADHNRWAPFGSTAGHLSLVVILAGAMVGSAFGFRDGEFMIAEGATMPVPMAPGLEVRLDAFRDEYYASTGAPSDYASDLVLFRDGTQVASQTIRVNDPLRYDGITFYQSFYGPAVVLNVRDENDAVALTEGIPLAWRTTEANRAVGRFSIPQANLVAWVVGTGGSADPLIKPGQVRVELYRADGDGAAVAAQTITQGTPTTISGLTFTFERERQFTGLSVARDPGVPLVWLGCFLLFAGFVVVFMFPHRRVWIRIVPRAGRGSTVSLATVGRRDTVGAGAEFSALVEDIRTALQAPSRS